MGCDSKSLLRGHLRAVKANYNGAWLPSAGTAVRRAVCRVRPEQGAARVPCGRHGVRVQGKPGWVPRFHAFWRW